VKKKTETERNLALSLFGDNPPKIKAVDRTASGTRQEVEDACFIAHSWQDIRDLLAEVEQLQAYSDKQYAIIVARDEQLQALE